MFSCKYCGSPFSNEELLYGHQGICRDNPNRNVNKARGDAVTALTAAYERDRISYDELDAAMGRLDRITQQHRVNKLDDAEAINEIREALENLLSE